MLNFPQGIQVFMAVEAVDMRKSFDGLSAAVQAVLSGTCWTGTCSCFSIASGTGSESSGGIATAWHYG